MTRVELSNEIKSRWPRSGSIEATYANKFDHWTRVGYEFASGNWYFAKSHSSQQVLFGRDPRGFYASSPLGREIEGRATWGPANTWFLDEHFPQIGLCQLLDDTEIDATIEAPENGDGWTVTFQLPRGMRYPSVGELPDAEVRRWGVGGSVLRPAVYQLRSDLTVASYTYPITMERDNPRLRTTEFDVSPKGPPGFQIISGAGGYNLSESRVLAGETPHHFDRGAVLGVMTERRLEDRERDRNPVVSAQYADAHPEQRPTPIEGRPTRSWTTSGAVALAGTLLVLLGIGAWWRSRRS